MGHGFEPGTAASFAIGWLVQSTVLLSVGLLVGRLRKHSGPAAQSVVYRTTLVAVLFCPAASALVGRWGHDRLALRLPNFVAQADSSPAPAPLVQTVAPASPASASQAAAQQARAVANVEADATLAWPIAPITTHDHVAPSPAPASRSRSSLIALLPRVGLATWLAGTVVLLVRLITSYARLRRLRASSAHAEEPALALCAELCANAGLRAPEVLRAPFLTSPCLAGVWRPAILLPEDDGGGLRAMLLHELAHLARRDSHWGLLRQLTRAVLWVQPLAWWLAHRLVATAEEACDDAVVQSGIDRAAYATQLLDLADRMLRPSYAAGIGIVALRSLLARRVVRILDPERSPSRRPGSQSLAWALPLGLMATLLAATLGVSETQLDPVAPPRSAEAPPAEDRSSALALAARPDDVAREIAPALRAKDASPEIDRAIRSGVKFLADEQQPDGLWKGTSDDTRCGITALATLAMLSAGEAADEPHVASALESLRKFRATQLNNTYNISLQTMAFAAAGLERDSERIADNAAWLVRAQFPRGGVGESVGSWSYTVDHISRGDNSNSDFALLGLDAAAQAGAAIDPEVWALARDYWRKAQLNDGGWAYQPAATGAKATASMTCAGLTALALIAPRDRLFHDEAPLQAGRDQLAARLFYDNPEVKALVEAKGRAQAQYDTLNRLSRKSSNPAAFRQAQKRVEDLTAQINRLLAELKPQIKQELELLQPGGAHDCGKNVRDLALERGFAWLAGEFSVKENRPMREIWKYYYLAGLERAGTLGGLRFLGTHDWYREGADELLHSQDRLTGSWIGTGVETDARIATSFALLFLARGRAPILIGKLRHGPGDDWNNDPHDVRNLTGAVASAWKQPLRWEIVEEDHAATADLLRVPIVFLNGHEAPALRPEAKRALRAYVEQGGTILAEACCSSREFDRGFAALVKELFPEAPDALRLLPSEHPIWSARHALRPDDHPLRGLDVNGRTAIIYSATDLSCAWQQAAAMRDDRTSVAALRLGENIVDYALTHRARDEP